MNTTGTYTLTYTVSDAAGNEASLTRAVNVVEASQKLFALDADTDQLIEINLVDGSLSVVGSLGVDISIGATMDYNPEDGFLYFSQAENFYRLNPVSGEASLVGVFSSTDSSIMAFGPNNKLYVHFEASAWDQGVAYEYDGISLNVSRSLGYPDTSLRSILGIDFDEEGNFWAVDQNIIKLVRLSSVDYSLLWTAPVQLNPQARGMDFSLDGKLRVLTMTQPSSATT